MPLQMKYINVLRHGRGPMITDIIIDGMGVLLGILLVMLVIQIYQKLRPKRQKTTKTAKM